MSRWGQGRKPDPSFDAEFVKAVLTFRGVTMKHLAKVCEVEPATVKRWLDEGHMPKVVSLAVLAWWCEVPIDRLLVGKKC